MHQDLSQTSAVRPEAPLGRESEAAFIGEIVDDARRGASRAVILRGPEGIGKSTLLDWAVAAVRDPRAGAPARVVRVTGVESEVELPYAALHILFAGMADEVDALPPEQAHALRVALGLPKEGHPSTETAKDRFLVGLAVLTLISRMADTSPLLCVVVDDADRLDEESAAALHFAARHLGAEGVVMLFAVTDRGRAFLGSDLPELTIRGLARAAAAALTARRIPRSDLTTRDRVVEAARGNPLALVELCTLVADSGEHDLADVDLILAPGSVSERIELAFGGRIRKLPDATRSLLLTAAADEVGGLAVLTDAAAELGQSLADLEPAERAGLVDVNDGVVTFRHSLIRRAVYRNASLAGRLAVHQALAHALNRAGDVDREAWHLAAGAPGADEAVAEALEAAADRAQQLGAYATSATAYKRAADFTLDNGVRVRLLTSAANAMLVTGRIDEAEDLAARVTALSSDVQVPAGVAVVRSHIESVRTSDAIACHTLLNAAAPLVHTHPAVAADLMARVHRAMVFAPDPAIVTSAEPLSQAITAALGPRAARRLTIGGHAARLALGDMDALGPLVRALTDRTRFVAGSDSLVDELGDVMLLLIVSETRPALTQAVQLLEQCRRGGMSGLLPEALHRVALGRFGLGAMRRSKADAVEGLAVAEAIGSDLGAIRNRGVLALHAALAGDERECRSLGELCAASASERDEPAFSVLAMCLLDIGLGRYDSVLSHVGVRTRHFHSLLYLQLAPDGIEAAMRTRRPEIAAEHLARYLPWAEGLAHNPAVAAVAYRCRALTANDEEAGALWTAALAFHTKDERPFDHARTLLLYGEWLRRMRRRVEARAVLNAALNRFEQLGAHPWVDRTRDGLNACGATSLNAGPRNDAVARLTRQEAKVARLAADGLADRDIAARLFLSPRTVSYHVSNVYRKLRVSSRVALAEVLRQEHSG
ncbi:LuxR family transcriptional regulator [Yinghuangia aomiensis]|uniref:LuxR family transcriptional regulator n=1 Tax=Yinghuangia aomiensis TaxID=676205 RepID=A0ABP9IEL0_9ACTN